MVAAAICSSGGAETRGLHLVAAAGLLLLCVVCWRLALGARVAAGLLLIWLAGCWRWHCDICPSLLLVWHNGHGAGVRRWLPARSTPHRNGELVQWPWTIGHPPDLSSIVQFVQSALQ